MFRPARSVEIYRRIVWVCFDAIPLLAQNRTEAAHGEGWVEIETNTVVDGQDCRTQPVLCTSSVVGWQLRCTRAQQRVFGVAVIEPAFASIKFTADNKVSRAGLTVVPWLSFRLIRHSSIWGWLHQSEQKGDNAVHGSLRAALV